MTEQAQNKKKFNLVRYVYGRIYASYLESGACRTYTLEDINTRRWVGIFCWLKKNNHIEDFKFGTTLQDGFKVTFTGFNEKDIIYPYYLKAIKNRAMVDTKTVVARDKSSEEECPFDGHIVEVREEKNRERIENSDRTTLELNREITKELVAQ